MVSPDRALVRADWDRTDVVTVTPDESWFDETWRDNLKGVSHLTSYLTVAILSTVVIAGFLFTYKRLAPAGQSGQEWVAIKDVNIHSKPDVSKKTRMGVCEQGSRLRVIGTRTTDKRTLYEVEFVGNQPADSKPPARKWIAQEYVTLVRP